jgi:hypothetical protein
MPTRHLFLTTSSYNGVQVGDLAGADSKCMSDPKAIPGLTYKALISTISRYLVPTPTNTGEVLDELDWPLSAFTSYVREDLTVVANTGSGKSLPAIFLNPISVTQSAFWTGINSNWTRSPANCGSFVSSSGVSKTSSTSAFTSTDQSCSSSLPLLCVQQ